MPKPKRRSPPVLKGGLGNKGTILWLTANNRNNAMLPKVTVYIPCRNYGRFLGEALESVAAQSLESWELFIFNEGSSDNTVAIAREFQAKFSDRVWLVESATPRGLRACANEALRRARGAYIIRLDADDILDTNALLVMSNKLDRNPDIGLVYPDWIYITEEGEVLGVERRKQIGKEVELLDLPAHGACTMIRKRVLKAVGGYDPQFAAQDGHELWLRLLHRFKVAHIATPLFSYRQHDASMSNDITTLLTARREIKRCVASRYDGPVKPNCVAIVPVMRSNSLSSNHALIPVAGRPLIDYTLTCTAGCASIGLTYVSTDDPQVVSHCNGRSDVVAQLWSPKTSKPEVHLQTIIKSAVVDMEQRLGLCPDIVMILDIYSPLRRPEHIREALDTLLIHEVDQVVSTYEDQEVHFRHGRYGLEPINPGASKGLRLERQALFASNGAIQVFWRDALPLATPFDGRIGHIVMSRTESIQAKHPEDRARVEAILLARRQIEGEMTIATKS